MQKSPPLSELTGRQVQWILGGAAMTLSTMAGQTNFIAQFNLSFRETFGLSHGQFAGIYTIATLSSAFLLIWAGALADRISARRLAMVAIAGLSIAAFLMSQLNHLAALVVTIAALRFFGQGMLGHIAMTSMARWFNRFRGRALSFAGLGFTLGEAALPFTITIAIAAFGWRQVWFGTACVLIGVMAPLVWLLLRNPPGGSRSGGTPNPDGPSTLVASGSRWTRGAVLRDPLFYAIILGIMGPPAIGTLFIFHQAHLNEIKGWDLTLYTAFFPVLSLTIATTAVVAGSLVDRFGAWRLMPAVLVPLAVASILVGALQPQWAIPVIFVAFGMSQGLLSPIIGALWVELYGTSHIGAVRALANSTLVAASAIGPGIAGYLIDAGVDLERQAYWYAAYCVLGSVLYLFLQRAFRARIRALAAY